MQSAEPPWGLFDGSVLQSFVCCVVLQHKRTCRRLLKHLPMIDNGEVEVDSLLVHNTEVIYKCSAVGGMR